MRILIDTHVLLWWDQELQRLSQPLREAIESGAKKIYVSAVTVWEIAIKRAIGKLSFDLPIVATVAQLGFEILPASGDHAEYAGALPRHHGDLFDRLLIAQADLEGMVFGTQDPMIRPYRVATLGLD